jgi:hypothetical protein
MESLEMEYMIAIGIAMMAGPVGARGDLDRAVRYLAASEEQLKSMGASIQPADKIEIDQVKNEFREKLGKTEYDKAWAEGQAMSLEQVFAMVVGESGA